MSQQQLKKYGTTFYFASRFLSSKQMEAAAALYGICREIDDVADKASDKVKSRSQLLELRNALVLADRTHPIVDKAMAIEPKISLEALVELTDGVLLDTEQVAIQTEAELLRYCYQVAGTVGLLMCDLFDVKDPVARHHAIDLGVAMQLTNICRDVLEDAINGRVYLPAEFLDSVTAEQIAESDQSAVEAVKQAVSYLLSEAEVRYESGISGLCFLPTQARLAIYIAALTYREIGLVVADRGFDVWQGRAHTTKTQKWVIALRSLISFVFSKKTHQYQGFHDRELHRGLNNRPGVHWA
ncbi:MAG: squalene/phytoene synthase family protein [Gammaproteobacteria bacterium]|nr:squalene/phytoene synthase family protein [Gammaproteobacteria bacterium]